MIRAAGAAPFIRYLDARGVPTARLLEQAGLAYYPFEAPEQAISFLSTMRFLTLAARSTGLPDLGARAADELALPELGAFGQVVLHAPDVRSAVQRAGQMMRHFSSHETLLLDEQPSRAVVSFHFSRAIDPADLHIAEQYSVMLVRRVIERSGFTGSCFQRVAFSSDPFGAFDALRGWLCDEIVVGAPPGLHITLRKGVLDRPLPQQMPRGQLRHGGWLPLGPQFALRESLGLLISTMLLAGAPSIGDLAQVSGMSRRSLQRQLHAEGTSFRELLDAQRRELALRVVRETSVSLSGLSQNLGYGHQGSLSRAVKRWTAETPRRLRRADFAESA